MRRTDQVNPIGEPLVGVREVMDFLNISRATVYRLAGRPGGVPCVKVGDATKFRPSDVREYAEYRTLRGTGGTRAEKLLIAARKGTK